MEMKKELLKEFNDQINAELSSSYLYLSMAAYFEAENLTGMAGWMKKQAKEEVGHGMKLYGFVNERGNRVELAAIPAPKKAWKNPLEVFKEALKHEEYVTERIHKLLALSNKLNDYPAASHLKWFVDEYFYKQETAYDIVKRLEMIGDSKMGLIMLDKELGSRQ